MSHRKSKTAAKPTEGEVIIDVVFKVGRHRHIYTLDSRITHDKFCESIQDGFGCAEKPSYVLRYNMITGVLVPLPEEGWRAFLLDLGPVRQRLMVVFLDGKPESNHGLLEVEPAALLSGPAFNTESA